MDLWLQEKYIVLLSNRLDGFIRKGPNLFNFRCVLCGDSEKSKSKARGYFYEKQGNYVFHCHNCNKSRRFEKFLQEVDPELYYEMVKEGIAERGAERTQQVYIPTVKKVDTEDGLKGLARVSDLPKFHMAHKYLLGRKIPPARIQDLWYCADYRAYVNSFLPDKLKSNAHAVPKVVIPFFNRNNALFGFQGRALLPQDEIRYLSIILDESQPKAYNLNRINFNKRYYVFEGPFDSMFFDNAMAACGSDVLSVLNSIGCSRENGVIVFDSEPRNHEIVLNITKAIQYGWKVVIWPEHWTYKDINEGILAGESASWINHLIDENTYDGMIANLKLNAWRRDEN